MAAIVEACRVACGAERLARTGARPSGSIVAPSRATQGVGPDSDAGEEMTLPVSPEVGGLNKSNVPLIHIPRRDVPRSYQVAKPLRGIPVVLVVIRSHSKSVPRFNLLRVHGHTAKQGEQ